MRVIIVEGSLDEVLKVLQKVTLEGLDAIVGPQNGDGGQNGSDDPKKEPEEGALRVTIPVAQAMRRLSQRERKILGMLMKGEPNKLIGRVLGIAEPTVKAHVSNIMKKIGVLNRAQAALWGTHAVLLAQQGGGGFDVLSIEGDAAASEDIEDDELIADEIDEPVAATG